MSPRVTAVSSSPSHTFSKTRRESIRLLAGLGVEGDAHSGETVKHRSRVAVDPTQPNLRQVHLIHAELHDELAARGFRVAPGDVGENVTTRGLDLLGLPVGTKLFLGDEAILEVTGLRNPCKQLDGFQDGLLAAVLDRAPDGTLIRKSGIMTIVLAGGEVRLGMPIRAELPPPPHRRLERAAFDELAVAEAYMDGDLDFEGEMLAVLKARPVLSDRHPVKYLWSTYLQPLLLGQVRRDKKWIASHYDVDPDFFPLWLDRRLRALLARLLRARRRIARGRHRAEVPLRPVGGGQLIRDRHALGPPHMTLQLPSPDGSRRAAVEAWS